MDDHDKRIRQRAHEIWEEEGRPEGREYSHWLRAKAEVAEEESRAASFSRSGSEPQPKEKAARASKADIARNTLPPGTVPENPTAENPDRIVQFKPRAAKKPLDGRDIDAQLDQPF